MFAPMTLSNLDPDFPTDWVCKGHDVFEVEYLKTSLLRDKVTIAH